MRRIFAGVLPLALGISAGALASSQPASAAPCAPTANYIAGWDGTNTCATYLWVYAWDIITTSGCKNIGAPNVTSYIWNATSRQFRAWTGPNCTGWNAPLYAHTAGPMGGIFDNNIDSVSRDT
jgi:hypothetical protein